RHILALHIISFVFKNELELLHKLDIMSPCSLLIIISLSGETTRFEEAINFIPPRHLYYISGPPLQDYSLAQHSTLHI
ncbi:MurR/RpiR family transcriptional regulator, partial [Staphylococcus pseudintermedius]